MKTTPTPSPEERPRFGPNEREFVFRIAMKILKNRDDAEDVAQDAMLRAFHRRHSYRGDAKFMTWLYRVAVTSSLMHLRRQRLEARDRVDAFDACTFVPAPGLDPEAQTIASAQVARAGRHLARISPIVGKVLRMNVEGYTSREIAAKLRLEETTVKMRVYRGRVEMRAALTPPDARAPAA